MPEVWLVIPEGNGKTSFLAAVALYYAEHKPGCSIPAAASSRDQGRRLYEQAAGFVKRTPRLKRHFRPYFGYRAVEYCRIPDLRPRCPEVHSRVEIYAADEGTGDGAIPDLALVDEGHRHRDLGLYRTWRGKVEKRGGQIVMISTGGEAGGEFEQTRRRIHEATPVVTRRRCFVRARSAQIAIHDYVIPEKGDPEDLQLVKEANPLSTITVASLRKKRSSPTMTATHWLRFTCNRGARNESAAISDAEWAAAATDHAIPAKASVDLGIDFGWKYDTTAIVPRWQRDATHAVLGPATVLTPPRDGTQLHPSVVKEAIAGLKPRYTIRRIVVDPSYSQDMVAWLRDEFGGENVIEHSQGDVQQAIDCARFMEGLRTGGLAHSADSVLTRHAMNANIKDLPGGRQKFVRKSGSRDAKQDERVIDALVAAAMVHAAAAVPVKVARDLPASASSSSRSRTASAELMTRAF